jgi:flavorubredoxin
MGFLPINAFVIKAAEPVLVDTGIGIESEEFMKALKSVIDPRDLKWIWISHDDSDHTGNIQKVLDAAPNARIAANAVTLLRMSGLWQVPMDRVFCLNSGESISLGDRKLTAVTPPLFDNPATLGFYDEKSEALFSADSFGAILPAQTRGLDELPEETLSSGMVLWATVDDPWMHSMEESKFLHKLDQVRQISPKIILSGHLPPAVEKTEQFLQLLATAPKAEPFVAPNQAALEQLMAQSSRAAA